jgi:predicted RNA-binding Zn-ribbon protein involved in translation (DUF1610 family)
MGANFDYFTTKDVSTSKLEEKYKDYCRKVAMENGHSYSGRLNMTSGLSIRHETFESLDDALDFIESKSEKWGDALAVKYKSYKIEPSKKLETLHQKIAEAKSFVLELNRLIDETVHIKLKSKTFHNCPSCKSKINMSKVRNTKFCPVCGESTKSASQVKKLETAKGKLEKLKSQANDELKKIKEKSAAKSKTYEWLVGGWCSS